MAFCLFATRGGRRKILLFVLAISAVLALLCTWFFLGHETYTKNALDHMNPLNWLDGPLYFVWKWVGIGATGGTAIAGGLTFVASGDNSWVGPKLFGTLAAIMMIIASVIAVWFSEGSPLMGWISKGFGIGAVLASVVGGYFLWTEQEPGGDSPLGLLGALIGGDSAETVDATTASGEETPTDAETNNPDEPEGVTPCPGPQGPVTPQCPLTAQEMDNEVTRRARERNHSESHDDSTFRNIAGPGNLQDRFGWRRRLIEAKFPFSDHSMLLAAYMALVCAAVYGFIHEAKYSENEKMPTIRSKHPLRRRFIQV